MNWASTNRIATTNGISRDSVYRHAHALDLFRKRQHNIRATLEKIIEKAGEVEVNAATVVSTIAAYGRINGRGEGVERAATLKP